MSFQSKNGMLVHRVVEQCNVTTVSPLGWVFRVVQVLVDCNDRNISMMSALCEEISNSLFLGCCRHEVIKDDEVEYLGKEVFILFQVGRYNWNKFYRGENRSPDGIPACCWSRYTHSESMLQSDCSCLASCTGMD